MPRPTGHGGQAESRLPKGPSREEAELLNAYDLMESRVRKLPPGLPWREIRIRRGEHGLTVAVTV